MLRRIACLSSFVVLMILAGACQPVGDAPADDGDSAEAVAEEAAGEAAPEEEAAEEQAAQTEALTQTHRAEGGGYSFDLPDGWAAVSLFGISMAAQSQSALDQLQQTSTFPDVPALIVVIGSPADFEGDFTTPQEMVTEMVAQQFGTGGDVTVGEPVGLTVGGLPAAAVDFSGTEDDTGQEVAGRLVAILGDERVGTFIGVTPPGQWDAFSPAFDAIVASVQFFEPNPDAEMESLGGAGDSPAATGGDLAPVEAVTVHVTSTDPLTVYAQPTGHLPNFCTKTGDWDQSRDGNAYTVALYTVTEDTPGCADSGETSFGVNIPLDVQGAAPGQYTVSVNGVTGSFQIGGSGSAPQSSACGNGTCSGGENAATCPADCSQPTSAGATCGNGIVEAGEQCEPGGSPCAAVVCEYSDCGDEVQGMTGCVSWSVSIDATCSSSCVCVSEPTCEDILP